VLYFFLSFFHDSFLTTATNFLSHVSQTNTQLLLLRFLSFISSTVGGALTCIPVGILSDRIGGIEGRKRFVYLSCALLAAGNIAFIFTRTFMQVLIVSFAMGGANGMYLTMDTSLAIDTLPSRKDAARFLGIWGVAAFVGTALGPMISGPMLYYFGETSVEGEYGIAGYTALLTLSALYFILSSLSLGPVEARVR
jgi:MFS family permease